MQNISSEQELKQLLEEGKITEEDYRQLLEAIHRQRRPDLNQNANQNTTKSFSFHRVPWQIWIIVVLLAWEGITNVFMIPQNPMAAIWLLAKVLFIIGLLRVWRWVFIVFLVIGAIHVLYFGAAGAWLVSFLNLILVILGFSAKRHFFPVKTTENLHYPDTGA